MDYTKIANGRYLAEVFINKPKDGPSIEVILNKTFVDKVPFVSVVIPIYNQEGIIERNLRSMLETITETPYEMILIVDACSDKTEEKVLELFGGAGLPDLLTNVVIMRSVSPLFETAADNLGFLCSRGEYILEIQADMQMTERGFNTVLLRPFFRITNLIAVSGRSCHGLTYDQGLGKMGVAVEAPLDSRLNRNCIYVGETCNRGPIILRRKMVEELGYLDEINYFLNYSEHDLFTRARVLKSWLCGYVPMEFVSPCSDGSTRKLRDPVNEAVFLAKSATCERNGFLNHWLGSSPEPFPIRIIQFQ
jgi:glycosyltransferase involved in cell wall biosynthesis